MLVDDDIYLKPDCSPVCNHQEVCVRCNRPHCVKSMVHSRLYGYVCVCGSQEYRPVIEFPKPARQSNTGLQADGAWTCPDCHAWNFDNIPACGECGYVRPPLKPNPLEGEYDENSSHLQM
jgi:hypothetical protein